MLARRPVHVELPEESRADLNSLVVWNRGTTAMFEIVIVNLDTGYYLIMMPKKSHAKSEKKN